MYILFCHAEAKTLYCDIVSDNIYGWISYCKIIGYFFIERKCMPNVKVDLRENHVAYID